jgi:hypothetical protein
VVTRLNEFDSVVKHPIDDAMLLINSPAPTTFEIVPQRLRFANSPEWIGENRRHQIKNPERGLPVCFNPVPKILTKIR